jgi:Fur family transcriptional regulator, ferric uptake regulator
MHNKEIVFKNYLNSKGLKFTPERSLILDTVLSMNGHFDVEKIHDKLRKKNKTISVATIYRSLPYLIDSGLIRKVLRCKNRPQYEIDMGRPHHDHMVCIKCGRVFEFRDDDIEKLQDKVCKKFHFKPVEHHLGIRGYCMDCLKKLKNRNS